jgi:EAL domain-containing protein (putative c-di-GMP-specific phosphodiesterase class I)
MSLDDLCAGRYLQGYYFSRALPGEEFISIALESRDVHSGYFSLKG